ncbi:hypothetical protein B0H19DRAFT_1245860 [Mycena capillaripes]|nr:hypothetical protein B0H19DRAFT_1245860 [Mycena capillaripes]
MSVDSLSPTLLDLMKRLELKMEAISFPADPYQAIEEDSPTLQDRVKRLELKMSANSLPADIYRAIGDSPTLLDRMKRLELKMTIKEANSLPPDNSQAIEDDIVALCTSPHLVVSRAVFEGVNEEIFARNIDINSALADSVVDYSEACNLEPARALEISAEILYLGGRVVEFAPSHIYKRPRRDEDKLVASIWGFARWA